MPPRMKTSLLLGLLAPDPHVLHFDTQIGFGAAREHRRPRRWARPATGQPRTPPRSRKRSTPPRRQRTGGEVFVPAGKYLIGSIVMQSNTTLRLDKDATIQGSGDKADYPLMTIRWEGKWRDGHRALIYAKNAKHIAIVGGGTIVGPFELANLRHPRGPCLIEPIDCEDVRLEISCPLPPDVDDPPDLLRERDREEPHDPQRGRQRRRHRRRFLEQREDRPLRHRRRRRRDRLKSGRGTEGVRIGKPTETSRSPTASWAAASRPGDRHGNVRRDPQHQGAALHVHARLQRHLHQKPHRPRRHDRNIDAADLDGDGPRVFLNFDLVGRGIQDEQPVPAWTASRRRATCASRTSIDLPDFPGRDADAADKPVENLSVRNVSGTCRRAIRLANMRGVDLKEIQLTGFTGPMIQISNVTGSGLENAVTTAPSTRAAPAASYPAVAARARRRIATAYPANTIVAIHITGDVAAAITRHVGRSTTCHPSGR
jgi:hypothetical protein